MDAVGDILAETQARAPEWKAGAVGTILLHAGLAASFLIVSRLPPPHRFISTQAVSVLVTIAGRSASGVALGKMLGSSCQ